MQRYDVVFFREATGGPMIESTIAIASIIIAVVAVLLAILQFRQSSSEMWRRTIADLVTRWPLPAIANVVPSDMGVLSIPAATDLTNREPSYVRREVDAALDEALESKFFLLITGRAGSGKTRTAYEAVRRQLPEYRLLVPRDGAALKKLAQLLPSPYQSDPLLIWLDELEFYLKDSGLTAPILTRWATARTPIKVVGTVRRAYFQALAREDPYDSPLQLATVFNVDDVTDREFQDLQERYIPQASAWNSCKSDNCLAAGTYSDDRCLAHLASSQFRIVMRNFSLGQTPLDGRGVEFTRELLRRVLNELPRNADGAPIFNGPVWLTRAKFADDLSTDLGFRAATFEKVVVLREANFQGRVDFSNTVFADSVDFSRAVFLQDALFVNSRFANSVDFTQCVFRNGTNLANATLPEQATFSAIEVNGEELRLDNVSFQRFIDIEVRTRRLSCFRSRFLGGGHLRVDDADVSLEQAEFPSPIILSGARPLILSLRQANLAGLVLNGGSLQRCRFADAHNLDQLRFDTRQAFLRAPARWQAGRLVLAEEVQWRQTHRRARPWKRIDVALPQWVGVAPEPLEAEHIAELYRALRKGREDSKDEPGAADFYYGEMEMRRNAASSSPVERLIIWLYWLTSGYALRAWRAVAALAATILLFGWLYSAIGFKTVSPSDGQSSSAITTTTVAPAQAATSGNASPQGAATTTSRADPSLPSGLLYSGRTAIGLAREPANELTFFGEAMRIINRIAVPVLLGLAILSIRGRVKR